MAAEFLKFNVQVAFCNSCHFKSKLLFQWSILIILLTIINFATTSQLPGIKVLVDCVCLIFGNTLF